MASCSEVQLWICHIQRPLVIKRCSKGALCFTITDSKTPHILFLLPVNSFRSKKGQTHSQCTIKKLTPFSMKYFLRLCFKVVIQLSVIVRVKVAPILSFDWLENWCVVYFRNPVAHLALSRFMQWLKPQKCQFRFNVPRHF